MMPSTIEWLVDNMPSLFPYCLLCYPFCKRTDCDATFPRPKHPEQDVCFLVDVEKQKGEASQCADIRVIYGGQLKKHCAGLM